MPRLAAVFALAFLLAVAFCDPARAADETADPVTVDCSRTEALAFMLGSWRRETQGTIFQERWERRADGHLIGTATAHSSEDAEQYQDEDMVIAPQGGRLVYAADPDGDGVFVEFTLVACGANSAVFENPDHDFPQRLAYRRDEDGVLHAFVTDLDDKGFELSFQPDLP